MARISRLIPKKSLKFRPTRPSLELLEDRCVPAALGLVPSGQELLQFYNNVITASEANRQQANSAIDFLQAQQIGQLNQAVAAVDGIVVSLLAQVTQSREQLNTDIQNGAPLQQQFADLLQLQADGQAAQAGAAQAEQLRAAAIQHTIQQLQLDAQLRFSINQMITQQETSFTTALLPFIQQAIINQPPDVGPALQANATVIYGGTFSTRFGPDGEGVVYTTDLSPIITVGADGVSLTGNGSAQLTTLVEISFNSQTYQATSTSVSGSLAAPNSNQAQGFFSFDYGPQVGVLVYPWAGALGLNKLIGQITDPLSGVTTPFTLNMVTPP